MHLIEIKNDLLANATFSFKKINYEKQTSIEDSLLSTTFQVLSHCGILEHLKNYRGFKVDHPLM